jgi:nitrous oxidase accessory protein
LLQITFDSIREITSLLAMGKRKIMKTGTLIIVLLFFLPSPGFAKVLTVMPGGGEFSRIQEAIAKASDGDTISVLPGTYYGNLTLDKDHIILEGKGKPIIQGEEKGNAVFIKGEHCVLRGFVVRGGGRDLTNDEAGLKLHSAHHSIIEDNSFDDNLHGIYLYRSDHSLIRRNIIHGRQYETQEDRGNGIHLWNSAHNRIEDNTITHARDGLFISFSHFIHIKGNRISNLRYGLHYMFSDDNSFEGNIFTHCVAGGALMYSERLDFRKNVFAHNRGFRAYGVLWQEVDFSRSEYNLILDNTRGLYFDNSHQNHITHNAVIGNDIALTLLASAEDNVFYENNFIGNTRLLVMEGGKNQGGQNLFSKDRRGNYWSDFRGYDLDGDGAGDTPHVLQNIFEYLVADYPEYWLYLYSPASQAVAMAEKVLPIIELPDEARDPHPLMGPAVIPEIDVQLHLLEDGSKSSGTALFLISIVTVLLASRMIVKGNRLWSKSIP